MDDQCGLWVVIEALRRASMKKLNCALFAVSTVQEEIGLRGAQTSAFGIDPHVGVAVDVTHATDCPTIDKKAEGDISLGKGPVIYRGPNMNPVVVERLIETAKAWRRLLQLAASGRATGTDANSPYTSAGVATGLVSIPEPLHACCCRNSVADRHRPRPICWSDSHCGSPGHETFTP